MPLTKIASLWKPREKNSKSLASGKSLGVGLVIPAGSRIVLLRNENKEGQQPDYEIFISDGQDRPQAQGTEYADEEAPF